jgi:TatD DNase family protein
VIDTHAHLDALADPPGEALARARAAGVTRVITVGSGVESCRRALSICEREEGVFAALGIHPHQADEADEHDIAELRDLLAHPKAVAVGETGLDHYRDYAPRDRQRELFREHVALATELRKPLIVHTRAAESETLDVLCAAEDGTGVVLHCFSSSALLEPALEHGWYVSFAGNVTYPNARELRRAAARVPAARILAETDSPYLAPQPVRGKPNEPAHVVHTVAALADARREDPRELACGINDNAAVLFGLS